MLTHLDGRQTRLGAREQLAALLAELDGADGLAHGAVSVARDDGWCLAVHLDGSVLLENLEELDETPSRWLHDVPRPEQLRLLGLLVDGDLESLEELGWRMES